MILSFRTLMDLKTEKFFAETGRKRERENERLVSYDVVNAKGLGKKVRAKVQEHQKILTHSANKNCADGLFR